MLRLHFNENPYGVVDKVRKKVSEALDEVQLRWYPDLKADALRGALSEYTGVSKDKIIVGNGSNEMLQLVVRAVDEVERLVIPVPTFGMYDRAAKHAGLEVSRVPLDEDFMLDVEGMRDKINEVPSAVIICHPNNPTGNYFDPQDIEAIIDSDARLIVMDEAYYELGGRTYKDAIDDDPRIVVVRTLSKGFGVAGLRVGYLLGDEEIVEKIKDVQTPYVLDSVSQRIAQIVVEHADEQLKTVDYMISRRKQMMNKFEEIEGMTTLESATNFFLVHVDDDKFGISASEIQKQMLDADVLVRNFDDLPEYLRVSVASQEVADEFFDILLSMKK